MPLGFVIGITKERLSFEWVIQGQNRSLIRSEIFTLVVMIFLTTFVCFLSSGSEFANSMSVRFGSYVVFTLVYCRILDGRRNLFQNQKVDTNAKGL